MPACADPAESHNGDLPGRRRRARDRGAAHPAARRTVRGRPGLWRRRPPGDRRLFWHSRVHAGGEIGYVLHPDFVGRGYATEAARALLSLGFDELGLHRVIARIDERNEASARVARRLGMRQEARLVHNELFTGEWSTELDFAMLADEWSAYRSG
ncbi:GNAT family N-acetyltransferase [Planosporangium sp. 12N6]|uniref:GNAT family N-acetyltransferase n=1 Tax=Planosporangium spinosum TaxID=3402278 RepID=UPI003CEFB0F7